MKLNVTLDDQLDIFLYYTNNTEWKAWKLFEDGL